MPLTDLVKDVQVRNLIAPLLSTIPAPVGLELKARLRRKGAGPLVGPPSTTRYDSNFRGATQTLLPSRG